jgi:hypothetical protein
VPLPEALLARRRPPLAATLASSISTPSRSLEPIITFAARENMDFESLGRIESSRFGVLISLYLTHNFNEDVAYEANVLIGAGRI